MAFTRRNIGMPQTVQVFVFQTPIRNLKIQKHFVPQKTHLME